MKKLQLPNHREYSNKVKRWIYRHDLYFLGKLPEFEGGEPFDRDSGFKTEAHFHQNWLMSAKASRGGFAPRSPRAPCASQVAASRST